MGSYAVSGASSGIGAAVAEKLRLQGHRVIGIDRHGADVNVDLATAEGRSAAVAAVLESAEAGLDGLVPCAGVGPQAPVSQIPKVNYFGAVALVVGLREALRRAGGSVVLISSNSATMVPYDPGYLEALQRHDEAGACALLESLDGQTAYGGSKLALARWMRRNNRDYAAAGIRMNAVAPGYTETAMTREGASHPVYGPAIKAFVASIPLGRPSTPVEQANVVTFLLGREASFVSGSVLFVDGGHDAMLQPSRL